MHKADNTSPSTPLTLAPGQVVKVTLDSYADDGSDLVQTCNVLSVDSDGDADLVPLTCSDCPDDIGHPWTLYASQVGAPADEGGVRVEVVEVAA